MVKPIGNRIIRLADFRATGLFLYLAKNIYLHQRLRCTYSLRIRLINIAEKKKLSASEAND